MLYYNKTSPIDNQHIEIIKRTNKKYDTALLFLRKYKHDLIRFLLPLLSGLFFTAKAQAHPHSWVDLQTTIEGDSTHITGFKMSWTFDAMTSFYMLEGEVISDQNRDQVLTSITNEIMDNLVLEHYFTYFFDGETPIPYLGSQEGVLTQHKTQLKLDFYIPLALPKEITNAPLKLQVYEPSYYVDINWAAQDDVQLSPQLSKFCSLQLIEPNPTPKQIGYAMSLPADAVPDHVLGGLFTQTIILQCAPPEGNKEAVLSEH